MKFSLFVANLGIALLPLAVTVLNLAVDRTLPNIASRAGFATYYPECLFVSVAMLGGTLLDVVRRYFQSTEATNLQSSAHKYNVISQVLMLAAVAALYGRFHPSTFDILSRDVNFGIVAGVMGGMVALSLYSCFAYYRVDD